MLRLTILLIALCFISQIGLAQDPSISGNIWVEIDNNFMYNTDDGGINGVKVYLRDFDSDEIIDSTLSIDDEFNFPSNSDIILTAGNYYLQIPTSEFSNGAPLNGLLSCPIDNNANDGVDNDDNGIGTDHKPLNTTPFPLNNTPIDYVDFCFQLGCDQENLLAATACDQIQETNIICDISVLATFCNRMPTDNSPGNQPNPLCSTGGTANNISWFAFTAYDGNYEIVLSPFYCTGSTTGSPGVQMGLYTDCTFTESVFCNPACSTDPITIQSSLLEPGQIYYFFIDGCDGTVCSYEIDINGNPLPPNLTPDDICLNDNGTYICDDIELFEDDPFNIQVIGIEEDFTYNWQISTLSGGPYTGDTNPSTMENNIDLSFSNEGEYTVCLTSIENESCSQSWFGNLCRTIFINTNECQVDTIPPVVQSVTLSSAVLAENDEVKIYAKDFILFAEDNCTPNESLVYAFNPQGPDFDEYYDATFNSSYQYLDCCSVVNSPVQIEVYVIDLDGNASADTIPTTVITPMGAGCEGCENDTIPPELVTIPNLTWVFPPDSSQIEVWASDFIVSAMDNCTGPSNIKYSFTDTSPFEDPSSSVLVILCDEVTGNPATQFPLSIYAWDKNGNYDMDSSLLIVQPQMEMDCDAFAEDISGTILNLDDSPIEGAVVYLESMSGNIIDNAITDENGNYSFFAIPAQKLLRIEYETTEPAQISFLDLIDIQQYMLGLLHFSTPEILASDINGDGKIRVNDLRILRKILLGVIESEEYLENTWKFSTQNGELMSSGNNFFSVEQALMPDIIGYRVGDVR